MGEITPRRRSGLYLIYRQIREQQTVQMCREILRNYSMGEDQAPRTGLFRPPPAPENRIHPPPEAAVLARFYCIQYMHIVDRTSSVQISNMYRQNQFYSHYFSYLAERSTNIHTIAAAVIEALSACFHQDRACPRCFKWSNTHALVMLA